jgi:hypothetical protein
MGASQALQLNLLDAVFGGGSSQSAWTGVATLYNGVSTSTYTTSLLDATIIAAEPTSAGSYARISVTNNSTNFPAATTSTATGTKKLHVSFSFPASTAAWSTGATALASFFWASVATLATGPVVWMGALSPATDVVNGSGVTFSYAIDAVQMTLAPA